VQETRASKLREGLLTSTVLDKKLAAIQNGGIQVCCGSGACEVYIARSIGEQIEVETPIRMEIAIDTDP
jgi:hypothetical protein